jgi:hypothetical protein
MGVSSLVALNIRLNEPQMWPGWSDEKKLTCYRQKLQSLHSHWFVLLGLNYIFTFPKVIDYALWIADTQARLHSIVFVNFYVVYIYINWWRIIWPELQQRSMNGQCLICRFDLSYKSK